ncbi:MAG: family 16 glycoside hydrolase, partial [Planctomycetaceae bacterium]
DQEFGDFEFLVEYRTVARADSGIYLRGNPQVQIWDYTRQGGKWNRAADKGSGGLFNNYKRSPGQEPLELVDRPFGEWNAFRIRQIGSRTDVWLNEKLVVDHEIMENYWDRTRPQFRQGVIQLQTHGGEIRWRNLFIREIGIPEANRILSRSREGAPADWVSAFNGKDFTGWQGDVASYEIVDGAIRCKAGQGGNLFTKDEHADFEVQLEFQLPPGGNNGLAIRFPGQGNPHIDGMCELQVLDSEHEKYASLDARQCHGSAYGMAPATRGFLRPTGEWNFQQIRVQGARVRVELNGNRILDADLSRVSEFMGNHEHPGLQRKQGFFGFAGHNDPVAFRKIRIRTIAPVQEWNRTSWPQFRGHNSSGLAVESTAPLPVKIGPDTGVLWKTALPAGHSSPVLADGRIFVTAVRDGKLVTIGLDQASGTILWERAAPHRELEEIHSIGSYAQCSPVTDGRLVISLFGSSGLYCYDRDGNEQWKVPMGPFVNEFGAGNSPLLLDGKVIVVQDHDADSFIAAFDVKTGDSVWKTDRSEFPRNYCSPVVWDYGGRRHLVVA